MLYAKGVFDAIYQTEVFLQFAEDFHHEYVLNFVNCFFWICQDTNKIFLYVILMQWIIFIDFQRLNKSCISDQVVFFLHVPGFSC